MIFYFSGTGNSQWVAEQLAERTNDTAFLIPELMKELEEDVYVKPDETVGVVFPVHAWSVPAVVMAFLSHVHVDAKSFTYAVATCSQEAGNSFEALKSVFPFKSAYTILMPEVFTPMFDLDPPELMKEKLNVAQQRLPKIAADISSKNIVLDIETGDTPGLKTGLMGAMFRSFNMNYKKFKADEGCNHCGKCVEVCPMDNIELKDGLPVWSERCQMCMACMMHCPVHAISCGGKSKKRGQYVNPFAGKNISFEKKTFYEVHPDNSQFSNVVSTLTQETAGTKYVPDAEEAQAARENIFNRKTSDIFADVAFDADSVLSETEKILGEDRGVESEASDGLAKNAGIDVTEVNVHKADRNLSETQKSFLAESRRMRAVETKAESVLDRMAADSIAENAQAAEKITMASEKTAAGEQKKSAAVKEESHAEENGLTAEEAVKKSLAAKKAAAEAKKNESYAENAKVITSEQVGLLKGDNWFVRALMTDFVNGEQKVTLSEVHLGLDAMIENFNNNDKNEYWHVLKGRGVAAVGGGKNAVTYRLNAGDTIEIRKGILRSVKNTGLEEFIFIKG